MNRTHDDDHRESGTSGIDLTMDANLRVAAPGLDLPEAPPGACWRGAAGLDVATAPRVAGRVRGVRRRLWAAVSGAAAMVAAGAAILVTTSHAGTVQASTIFESLRRAQVQGVRIVFREVQTDNARLDGEVHVRFAEPLKVAAMLDGDERAEPRVAQALARLRVRLGDGTPVPGLDLSLDAALSDPSTWMHVQANEAAIQALHAAAGETNPLVTMVTNMARSGILLDLGGGAPARLEEWARAHRPRHAQRGDAGSGDSLPVAVRRLLTGDAGQQELDEVVRLLREGDGRGQGPAKDATIELTASGEYVLTASLHSDRDHGPGPASGAPSLRIGYAPGAGVRWLEVSLADPGANASGSVRVDFLGDAIEPSLLDKGRVMVEGRTAVIGEQMLRAWLPVLRGGGGSGSGSWE